MKNIKREILEIFSSNSEEFQKRVLRINDSLGNTIQYIHNVNAYRKNQDSYQNYIDTLNQEESTNSQKIIQNITTEDYSGAIEKISELGKVIDKLEDSLDKVNLSQNSGSPDIDFFGGKNSKAKQSKLGKVLGKIKNSRLAIPMAVGIGAAVGGYAIYKNLTTKDQQSNPNPTPQSSITDFGSSTYIEGNFKEDPEFTKELNRVAKKFNIDANDLLGVMQAESRLNPSAVNQQSGATGLIQFMPKTAVGLGTTTEALRKMSRAEQMQYVEKYFDQNKLPYGANAAQIYATIFMPAKRNSGVLAERGTKEYAQNAGLDLNRDGYIDQNDLMVKIQNKREELGLPRTSNQTGFQKAMNMAENFYENITDRLTGKTSPPVLKGEIRSHFGHRVKPNERASSYHKGIDISVPSGTPVYSVKDGVVTKVGPSGNGGNRIEVTHGKGETSVYMHLSHFNVKLGENVSAGQEIAKSGETGNTTGPHLHFEYYLNGKEQNPEGFMNIKIKPKDLSTKKLPKFDWSKANLNGPKLLRKPVIKNPKTKGGNKQSPPKNINNSEQYKNYF